MKGMMASRARAARRGPVLLLVSCARHAHGRWGVLLLSTTLALGGCAVTLGQTTPTGPGTVISVKVVRGQENSVLVLVPVSINGHGPYNFILDTGASVSLIDTGLAEQLDLPLSGQSQPVSGIGGTEQVVFVSVQHWQLGTSALPKATVGTGSLPSERRSTAEKGLLGSDILSQFGTITVNYDASTLTVYRAVAGRAPQIGARTYIGRVDHWRRAV